jgi:hypothetical protein
LAQKLPTHSTFFIFYFLKKFLCTIQIMFSGPHETAMTEHSVWSRDAHVVMQDVSQLKLIAMSLLQTCGYVTQQMRTAGTVSIDVNKFMESFSIKAEGGDIHPPSWTAREDDTVSFSPATAIIQNPQTSSLITPPNSFTMKDYRRCRQAEAIRWINLQETRASVIARLHPIAAEEYQKRRDAINSGSGPLRMKGMEFHLP